MYFHSSWVQAQVIVLPGPVWACKGYSTDPFFLSCDTCCNMDEPADGTRSEVNGVTEDTPRLLCPSKVSSALSFVERWEKVVVKGRGEKLGS